MKKTISLLAALMLIVMLLPGSLLLRIFEKRGLRLFLFRHG